MKEKGQNILPFFHSMRSLILKLLKVSLYDCEMRFLPNSSTFFSPIGVIQIVL